MAKAVRHNSGSGAAENTAATWPRRRLPFEKRARLSATRGLRSGIGIGRSCRPRYVPQAHEHLRVRHAARLHKLHSSDAEIVYIVPRKGLAQTCKRTKMLYTVPLMGNRPTKPPPAARLTRHSKIGIHGTLVNDETRANESENGVRVIRGCRSSTAAVLPPNLSLELAPLLQKMRRYGRV